MLYSCPFNATKNKFLPKKSCWPIQALILHFPLSVNAAFAVPVSHRDIYGFIGANTPVRGVGSRSDQNRYIMFYKIDSFLVPGTNGWSYVVSHQCRKSVHGSLQACVWWYLYPSYWGIKWTHGNHNSSHTRHDGHPPMISHGFSRDLDHLQKNHKPRFLRSLELMVSPCFPVIPRIANGFHREKDQPD